MKKLFSIFILFIMVAAVYAQNGPSRINKLSTSSAKDDNYNSVSSRVDNKIYPTIDNPFAPAGTVPFPFNANDYGSNGNCMRKLIVLGDTVIVGQDINPDITGPPPVTTTTHVWYQVSYNGGTSWLSPAINTSPAVSNRWANIEPIFSSGLRSVCFTGRIYISNSTATQGGLAMVETLLGLGSLTNYIVPAYRDYFGYYKNSTTVGGVVSTPAGAATDSLVYIDFNYANGTFGSKKVIASALAANFRYTMAIADNGQNIFSVWWNSVTSASIVNESTDGGNTWNSPVSVGTLGTVVGGDSIISWFGIDVIYKPSSTKHGLAFSTLAPGSFGTREGSKLLYYSPTINGGNPVIIMDHNKYLFTNDTALYNNNRNFTQVGATNFSHPSLGYSDDGTVLYCAFSAVQKDTSGYIPYVKNFAYFDIMVCKSTDDGLTWGLLIM